MPVAGPCGGLAAGLVQDPAADLDDPAAALRERDELVRRDHAPDGMAPAQQCLDADHRPVRETEDRLVNQEELLASERAAEVGLQLESPSSSVHHARLEQRVAVLSGGLGRVEREVRIAQERVGRAVGTGCHTDARRHREDLAAVLELDGLAQRLRQAVGETVERNVAGAGLDKHDELVAAEASDGVLVAYGPLQSRADGLQQGVAGGVPEVVVDVLEAVDVDEQRPWEDPWIARRAREQLLRAVEHECAVGQPRERVVQRLVRELARLLEHERERSPAPRAEHDPQRPEQEAEQDSPDEQRQCVHVAEDAAGCRRREALHGPAVAEVDLRCLRAGQHLAAVEGDVRPRSVVAEHDRDVRMALQRTREHHLGNEQLAKPALECASACCDCGRRAPTAVDGRLDAERRHRAGLEGGVARFAVVARHDQRGCERAVVQHARQVGLGVARQARHGEAVEGPVPGGQYLFAFGGTERVRAERPERVGCHVRLKGCEVRRGDELHQADVLELGEALHRAHRFDPAVEVGCRAVGVGGCVGARADDEVFLVQDRELQRGGDLRGREVKGEPCFVGIRARDGLRAENRGERTAENQQGREDPPHAAATRQPHAHTA